MRFWSVENGVGGDMSCVPPIPQHVECHVGKNGAYRGHLERQEVQEDFDIRCVDLHNVVSRLTHTV